MSVDRLSWQSLRADLADDCQPVTPLRPVRSVVQWVIFLATTLLLILLGVYGLRVDAHELGTVWLWLPSLIEIMMALALLSAGLDEATPGRGQHRLMVAMGVGAAGFTHFVVASLTFRQSPMAVPDDLTTSAVFLCMRMELLLAVPFLIAAIVILRRGTVTRPARAGVCLGIGAGMGADALWRLVCPFADLHHVLSAHLTGIVGVALAGTLLGIAWDRWRLRRWPRTRPSAHAR